MAAPKRELIIDIAGRLFYEHGYHATGIAEILKEANVAKGTLYQHFDSKEDLLEAVLRRKGEEIRSCFTELVEKKGSTPKERLCAVFSAHHDLWWGNDGFCGCPFTKILSEFSDRDHPVYRLVGLNKRLINGYIRDLAAEAGARDPEALARQLFLLLEGAAVLHGAGHPADVTRDAERAAQVLIESAI
ncbi:MAG: TetR/AcrR family transcriptional regulator [Leptospirillia bacterium]